jgi:predicted Zn-dependent protease
MFTKGRLIIAALIALISSVSYFMKREVNPVTQEVQHVSISPEQEVALGLQATPEMMQQFGGRSQNAQSRNLVLNVGKKLVQSSVARQSPYSFDFHLLADAITINAFALPGGQIFVTEAMLAKLTTEGQLAGVLGHEIGHVIARHGAEHIAKQKLTQGLTGAAIIASYDPSNPNTRNTAAVALLLGQLVNMKFGRNDELESDKWGVKLMSSAGYDPNAMLAVMNVLQDAAKGPRPPEFFSTHPNPDNRLERIQEVIQEEFPGGAPIALID